MSIKDKLQCWVYEAVKFHSGRASVLAVAKHIWKHHSKEIEASGDDFYTWQYDMRWAAQKQRNRGKMRIGLHRSWETTN